MMRRVLAGMGAHSFGMAVNIGIQLASLPLFLMVWDTASYGNWLMLSALPAYLSMADVGMVTAAGNRMNMAMGREDAQEARRIFHSAQLFMLAVCGSIALLALPAALLLPIPGVQTADMRVALALLSASTLVALCGGLSEAVFKATQRYATGTMLGNCTRLAEWLGMMLGLVAWGSYTSVALGGLACRLLGVACGMWLAQRGGHPLRWGLAHANRGELRAMAAPALSFMAFPLSNALNFQGVTLLVGALFGPGTVVLFNTYRTLCRVAVQATAAFSFALWPEFSSLYGRADMAALQHVFRRSSWVGLVQALLLSALLYPLAPWLLHFWTHSAVAFEPDLMGCMVLYAAVAGAWHVPRVLLMASNAHGSLASASIAGGLLTVGLAWLLGRQQGIQGVVLAMLLSELAMALLCLRWAWRLLGAAPQPPLELGPQHAQ